MPAGLQVFNDAGVLQIDGTFKNMVLTAVGTATLGKVGGAGIQPYPSAGYYRISYPVSSRQPILALRSSANVCFLTDDNGFTVFGAEGTSIGFYVYDRVDFGNGAGNSGFQVFNEQGVEVFNANNRYMRVLGSYSVNIPVTDLSNTAPTPTFSGVVDSNKAVAVCMGVQSTGHYTDSGGTSQQPAAIIRYWQCQVRTPDANTFTLSNGIIQVFAGPITVPPGTTGSISPYNSGLLLDVTGI
ncbi:hypothetical protein F3J44_18295 [Pantoea sp. Tr-811]|uniref:hypothetical protein n=1 Tax=Pantoea sp. Tr-811 TaxID=2608361 RepID=UPI001422FA02|nr:hypothetical protein [Pantoea sp. Tr-811]NIF28322.1 hypothetical protein [Pantoea sp. Tr-811]